MAVYLIGADADLDVRQHAVPVDWQKCSGDFLGSAAQRPCTDTDGSADELADGTEWFGDVTEHQ